MRAFEEHMSFFSSKRRKRRRRRKLEDAASCKVLAGQAFAQRRFVVFGRVSGSIAGVLTNLTSITTLQLWGKGTYVNRPWARAEEKGGSAFRLNLLTCADYAFSRSELCIIRVDFQQTCSKSRIPKCFGFPIIPQQHNVLTRGWLRITTSSR